MYYGSFQSRTQQGLYRNEQPPLTQANKSKDIIEVGEDMKTVIKRFLASGMTMEEVSAKMDVSIADLAKLLNS